MKLSTKVEDFGLAWLCDAVKELETKNVTLERDIAHSRAEFHVLLRLTKELDQQYQLLINVNYSRRADRERIEKLRKAIGLID